MNFFSALLKGLTQPFNWIIIAAFAGALWRDLKISRQVKEVLHLINSKTTAGGRGIIMDWKRGSFVPQVPDDIDMRVINDIRQAYGKITPRHNASAQIVSLFPLLGLLGTVCGLIPSLANAEAEVLQEALTSNMTLALISTFLGLVAAIVLKLHLTMVTAQNVDQVDDFFEDIDRTVLQQMVRETLNNLE